MQVDPTIHFRDVPHSPAIEALVRAQVVKLERFCDHITSCRVAIERPQVAQRAGNPHRIRIEVTVPPGHQVVVDRTPLHNEMHAELETVVIDAFKTMRRRLQQLVDRQRGDVKPRAEPRAMVARLFRDEGYGFLTTPDGRDLYFHRHSVLHGDWEHLAIGTEVRFAEEDGDEGPQASSVQVVAAHHDPPPTPGRPPRR